MVNAACQPPPGLVPVPVGKGCVLLLTQPEYLAALRRGKAWRRRVALLQRTQAGPSGDDPPSAATPLATSPTSGQASRQEGHLGGNLGASVTSPGPTDTSSRES